MLALECDRCGKRIGTVDKGALMEEGTLKVRMHQKEKLLCPQCTKKMERFMANEDDLRAVVAQEGGV